MGMLAVVKLLLSRSDKRALLLWRSASTRHGSSWGLERIGTCATVDAGERGSFVRPRAWPSCPDRSGLPRCVSPLPRLGGRHVHRPIDCNLKIAGSLAVEWALGS